MKKNWIYIAGFILFILLFLYVNNQIHVNINAKESNDIREKIEQSLNYNKELHLEYYMYLNYENIEQKALKKGFLIKGNGDYQIIIDEKN